MELVTDWHRIGNASTLDWHLIDIGLAMDQHEIGVRWMDTWLMSDWRWIGNEMTTGR